jgi:tetratricopeptide (TPR) repeat protein
MTADVDTRGDVYSLGALLYELLVGESPLRFDEAARSSVQALLNVIRSQDPLPPSRRIQEAGERAAALAARRGCTPRALARRLHGDLDWVVARALDKDRERRYAAAGALADDLERHLRDEPVLAGPPSHTYRLWKLVRRHRAATIAAAAVALSLVAGLALAGAGLMRARAAERLAVAEAATAREVSEFLTGLFAASDPVEERRAQTTARELLDVGAAQLAKRLDDQPVTKARLLTTIGAVYDSLGALEEAREKLEAALAVHGSGSGAAPLDRAQTLVRLAAVERRLGRLAEAEPHARQALQIRRAVQGDDHPDAGAAWDALGGVLVERGDWKGAEQAFDRARAIAEATAPGGALLGARLNNLAGVYWLQGRFAESLASIERAVELTAADRGEDYPVLGHMLDGLGLARYDLGDYRRAEEVLTRSLGVRTRTYGPDHYTVGESQGHLAMVYTALDRPRDGVAAARRAIDILTRIYGPDHQRVANVWEVLGTAHSALREFDAARVAFERSHEIRKNLPPDHPDRALGLLLLGTLDLDAGNLARARELLAQALAERAPLVGEGDAKMVDLYAAQARLERKTGNTEQAIAKYERVLDWSERAARLSHPKVRSVLLEYAALLRERGENARAAAVEERLQPGDAGTPR